MKKEVEIIQFVSKPYFSKFHPRTGFMNLSLYALPKLQTSAEISCGVGVKIVIFTF